MTKRELIYTVYERLKVSSDDTDLSEEFVSSLIDATRAKLVRQNYSSKTWNTPIEIKQELCLGLESISSIEGMTCHGTILRTKDIIPKGITVRGSEGAVLRVKRYDRKALQINIVPIERFPMIGHNPHTSGLVYAAIDVDRRIYILSGQKKHSFLEAIKVEGIYEKPDEAMMLGCNLSDDAACEPWDEEYPMEAAMQDTTIEMVVTELTKREALPEDNLNDSEDGRK